MLTPLILRLFFKVSGDLLIFQSFYVCINLLLRKVNNQLEKEGVTFDVCDVCV